MKNLIELRKAMKAKIDEARALTTTAQNESRSMTEEEGTRYDSLMDEVEARRKEIEREERLQQQEMDNGRRAHQENADDKGKEFRNIGEFINTVVSNPRDSRLHEARDMNMSEGAKGGFLVPKQFSDELLRVETQDAIIRPRARVIPAGESPDASIGFPALNQSAEKGVFGGVQVKWIGEGALKPQSEAEFVEIELKPVEVAGHVVVTDRLLNNATAASSILTELFRDAILASEDFAFMYGNGVGMPLGFVDSPAAVTINRAVANQISYADVVKMFARAKFGGQLVWIANQSILPQLMTMADGNGNLIWQPNAVQGSPGSLLGVPVVMNEFSNVLGTKGDLILADLKYYLIKDGTGLTIKSSEHVYFTSNKTVIKFFKNTDGQPWLRGPYTQMNGTYSVSPFIVLAEPA